MSAPVVRQTLLESLRNTSVVQPVAEKGRAVSPVAFLSTKETTSVGTVQEALKTWKYYAGTKAIGVFIATLNYYAQRNGQGVTVPLASEFENSVFKTISYYLDCVNEILQAYPVFAYAVTVASVVYTSYEIAQLHPRTKLLVDRLSAVSKKVTAGGAVKGMIAAAVFISTVCSFVYLLSAQGTDIQALIGKTSPVTALRDVPVGPSGPLVGSATSLGGATFYPGNPDPNSGLLSNSTALATTGTFSPDRTALPSNITTMGDIIGFSTGFIPGYVNTAQFQQALRRELDSSGMTSVLSVVTEELAFSGAPVPRIRMADLQGPVRKSAGSICEEAFAALSDTIEWTQKDTNTIIGNLDDLMNKDSVVGSIWWLGEASGAEWVPQNMLERATGTSWDALPDTGMEWGKGVFVYPRELERIISGESTYSLFHPKVMFTHTSDAQRQIAELHREEYKKMTRSKSSWWSRIFGGASPSYGTETVFNPLTAPKLSQANATRLLSGVPFVAGIAETPGGAKGMSLAGDTFSPFVSYWDDWIRDSITKIEAIDAEVHRKKMHSLQLKVMAANTAIGQLNEAIERVRMRGDEFSASIRTELPQVPPSESEPDEVYVDAAVDSDGESPDEEPADPERDTNWLRMLLNRQREAKRAREEAERLQAGAATKMVDGVAVAVGLVTALKYAGRRSIESYTNSAALGSGGFVGFATVYLPSKGSTVRVKGAAPILAEAWKILVSRDESTRFNDDMKTLVARFEDTSTKNEGMSVVKATRHVSRMQDIELMYDKATAKDMEKVLSLGKLRIDDPAFWLRIYLWEVISQDLTLPYTKRVKEDLFSKVRYGEAPIGASKCQNPDCAYGTDGNAADSDVFITRSGKVWALLGIPQDNGLVSWDPAPTKLLVLDEMHDQRKVIGYCWGCARKSKTGGGVGIEQDDITALNEASKEFYEPVTAKLNELIKSRRTRSNHARAAASAAN